jgi:hypothetical protein
MIVLGAFPSESTRVPRNFRRRFLLIRAAKWLVPAPRCLTFPFAESRNRFLTPLWVFCLGMTIARGPKFVGRLNPPL